MLTTVRLSSFYGSVSTLQQGSVAFGAPGNKNKNCQTCSDLDLLFKVISSFVDVRKDGAFLPGKISLIRKSRTEDIVGLSHLADI